MRRVTLCRVVPINGVETEEEFDVAKSVRERAEHVAQEKVSELDGEYSSET
jgi:hypothetical protein